jgi:hypothetical protein
MSVQDVLDFAWPHLVAGRVDHVLLPVDQVEPAQGVDATDISGAQFTTGQRSRRRLGFVPVPRHDLRAGRGDLISPTGTSSPSSPSTLTTV